MNAPFDSRLRAQLLAGLPTHRRRRRRRDRAVVGATAVVLVVGAGFGLGRAATDDGAAERTDTRPVPTATTATTAPSETAPPSTRPDVPLPEGPPLLASASPTEAVTGMLAALRTGDLESAGSHWTGYPEVLGLPGDDVVGEKGGALAALALTAPWLLDPEATTTVGEAGSHPGRTGLPVVTVVAATDDGPRAAAFVVAPDEGGTGWVVAGLPTTDPVPVTPRSGSTVAPGSTITFLTSPLEGGARAYVDGVEVPVEDDRGAMELRVTVPDDATGAITVTVGLASPEVPTALAATYTVG